MKKATWLRFAFIIAAIPVLIASTATQCNHVLKIGATSYRYKLYHNVVPNTPGNPPACNGDWRNAQHLSENYNFCWVFSDGSFMRTLADPPFSGTQIPYTAVNNTTPNTGPLAFTGVANRKGDDTDKKKIAGGSDTNPNNNNNPLSYTNFPTSQQEMAFPKITRIQTDFNSDLVANNDEVLLIITINNDSIEDSDSLFQLMKTNYNLHLYHSNANVHYDHSGSHGVNPNAFPADDEKYFEFANHSAFHPLPSCSTLTQLCEWKIVNTFKGHEKNVYCLLTFSPSPSASDADPIKDTFTVVLSDPNSTPGYQVVANSRFDFPYKIGASHDPNIIQVNHPVSTTCAAGEELEYTIHFQNTGIDAADSICINLELDSALDPTTLQVWEAGIGTQSLLGSSHSTTPLSQSTTPFSLNAPGSFGFTKQAVRTTTSPAVGNDVTFNFQRIDLKGITATDMEDSKGHIRFTIKTRQAFTSIHNRAGIFFDRNPEIVTNLAETICLKDSINMNCDSCRMHLRECRDQLNGSKTDSSNSWMNWLGWIIAGLELLVIVYLLTRKRN